MTAKALIFAITLVILSLVLVFMVELFIPLSAKIEFDSVCRKTILKMELEGGINENIEEELLHELNLKGFTNLLVEGASSVKYGQDISLKVEGDYNYSSLISLFTRENLNRKIAYDRTTISRKVIN